MRKLLSHRQAATTNKDDVPSTSELTSKSGSLPPRAANLDLPPAEPVKAAAENTNGASTTVELTPDQTSRSRLSAHVVTAADDDDGSGPVIVVDARVSLMWTPARLHASAFSSARTVRRDRSHHSRYTPKSFHTFAPVRRDSTPPSALACLVTFAPALRRHSSCRAASSAAMVGSITKAPPASTGTSMVLASATSRL